MIPNIRGARMTKSPNKEASIGDLKAPALKPTEDGLRYAAGAANEVPGSCAAPVRIESAIGSLATALKEQAS